jgi:alkanesulfonate monooxygenase SsuD/methylene tetrahydromethanopterin reductase-like flavin-dependent oxidoreductase (luciferase family)
VHAQVLPGHLLPIQPQSPGLDERVWYGAGNIESARRVGELGMHLMSSTLVLEATGEPLDVIQARQIDAFRESWATAGHEGEPRVSVSRSVMPIVDDLSRLYFGPHLQKEIMGGNRDQIGEIDNSVGTFGKTYVGEPEKLIKELLDDRAVMSADTLLVTVPSQLGADFNHESFKALAAIRDALGA